jgi:hypothetical protein
MLSSSLLARSLRSSSLRTFARPLSTSPPLLASSLFRPSTPRYEVSKVAQQPASKSVKDVGRNALEEASGVVGSVAEAVAGGNDVVSQRAPKENFGAGDVTEDLVSTLAVSLPLPLARNRSSLDVVRNPSLLSLNKFLPRRSSGVQRVSFPTSVPPSLQYTSLVKPTSLQNSEVRFLLCFPFFTPLIPDSLPSRETPRLKGAHNATGPPH